MKRLELVRPEYIDDTKRIIKVALDHNLFLTPIEAEIIWLLYSDDMAANWMMLPDEDIILWEIINNQQR